MSPFRRGTVAVLAAAGVLAGCGGLPTPSGVRVVRHVAAADAADTGPDVTRFPAGPAQGSSPDRVVVDFLAAAAGQEDDPAVAREFLAPDAAWDSGAGVHVYNSATTVTPAVTQGGTRVDLQLQQVGFIDQDGSYLPFHRTVPLSYTLRRTTSGDWRIRGAPPGIYLTESDVARDYRSGTVYRLARSSEALVPEPVALRVPREGLASALVRTLLRGPGRWIAPATRSGVVPGTILVDSVTLVGGVTTVNLSREARQLSAGADRVFLRQLTGTLADVPGVERLRLLVEGRPLFAGESTVPVTAAPAASAGDLFAVTDGTVGMLRGSGLTRVAAGTGAPVRVPAASADGWIAALRGGPGTTQTVIAAPGRTFTGTGPVGNLTAPSWITPGGAAGAIVGVQGSSPARAALVRDGHAAAPVTIEGLAGGALQSLTISPDGARVAAVVGSLGGRRVEVGRVGASGGRLLLDGWESPGLPPGMADVADVTWTGGTSLALSGAAAGGTAALGTLPLDEAGTAVSIPRTGLPAGPFAVAGSGGGGLVVGAAGALWRQDRAGWRRVAAGTDPAYAP